MLKASNSMQRHKDFGLTHTEICSRSTHSQFVTHANMYGFIMDVHLLLLVGYFGPEIYLINWVDCQDEPSELSRGYTKCVSNLHL